METIKVIVKKTTTIDKEVVMSIPNYRKDSVNNYKVISEKECIKVCNKGYHDGIEITFISLAFNDDSEECTESEFLEAYNEVRNKLEEIATK